MDSATQTELHTIYRDIEALFLEDECRAPDRFNGTRKLADRASYQAYKQIEKKLERMEGALKRIRDAAPEEGDGETRPLSREMQKIAAKALGEQS